MARIIYSLSGMGRGHGSRVLAISKALEEHGHEILFCCGGTSYEVLREEGKNVVKIPFLEMFIKNNRVNIFKTFIVNFPLYVFRSKINKMLAKNFIDFKADLMINDFEPYTHPVAVKLNIPIISLNHQQIISETKCYVPDGMKFDYYIAKLTIRLIAPQKVLKNIITSFFFLEVKNPQKTVLVGPILRKEIIEAAPEIGDYILVYTTQHSEYIADVLKSIDHKFVVYNSISNQVKAENITIKELGKSFLDDLISCKAVISSAGNNLISEALYLGKPLLALPSKNTYEQIINALYLKKEGLGDAVINRDMNVDDVQKFIGNLDLYHSNLTRLHSNGNIKTLELIEEILKKLPLSF